MIKALKGILNRVMSDQGYATSTKDAYATRRRCQRFKVHEPELLTAQDHKGKFYRMIDLSYQGCLLEPVGPTELNLSILPSPNTLLTLRCLNLEIQVVVLNVQLRRNGVAIVFGSQEDANLTTLSHLIEPLKCGSTSVLVKPPSTLNEPTFLHRKRFVGDGPFDLVVERDQTGDVSFMMGCIRVNEVYGSLILEKGQLLTKKSLDRQGVGARMLQTQEIDKELVTLILLACLGVPFHEAGLAARSIINHMSKLG